MIKVLVTSLLLIFSLSVFAGECQISSPGIMKFSSGFEGFRYITTLTHGSEISSNPPDKKLGSSQVLAFSSSGQYAPRGTITIFKERVGGMPQKSDIVATFGFAFGYCSIVPIPFHAMGACSGSNCNVQIYNPVSTPHIKNFNITTTHLTPHGGNEITITGDKP